MSTPRVACLLAIALLAGCATERVVLLPSPDGHASKLEVVHGANRTELAAPYAAVAVSGDRARPRTLTADDVQKQYGRLLEAMPALPRSYVVYFETGSTENVLPESVAEFERALQDAASRVQPEVTIIGHSDRVGELEFNDRLSGERAEAIAVRIRERLRVIGLTATLVDTAGRGEREPMVETADEVDEARNRRVEINVR